MACVALMACNGLRSPSSPTKQNELMIPADPHSCARPAEAAVRHVSLNLNIDFTTQTIAGTATCNLNLAPEADTLMLDTRALDIISVESNGKPLTWSLGNEQPFLGKPLTIHIGAGDTVVTVKYRTTAGAEALQWLAPEQTEGGKYPFLFTQSQAILARTWIPCQDSPGIRFTYDATVTVPKGMLALMSASNPVSISQDGVYHFEMKQRIPAYLMALSVGDLQFKPVGARTGIYAEPAMLERAAWEFADMENMVVAAEELYGPYRWERYDLIVLPPSFPFGGMENPRLTFCTPTVVAGDRSLTSLVAHELAHSWSGNLVTNATWNDFWLNEGFTVYFERRIMEKLYGKDYSDMLEVLGWQDLQETLGDLSREHPEDTKLKLSLEGRNPDDGMNDVAYEKGNAFLLHIERCVGRPAWDAFLRTYFDTHAFGVMATEGFLEYLEQTLIKGDAALRDKIGAENWIYQPGLPTTAIAPVSARFNAVDSLADQFKQGAALNVPSTEAWTAHEWVRFLRQLPDSMPISYLEKLNSVLGGRNQKNAEIAFAWYVHVIASDHQSVFPQLEQFLLSVGRRKFVKPLYQELIRKPEHKTWALKVYPKARGGYHAVTVNTLDAILGWK